MKNCFTAGSLSALTKKAQMLRKGAIDPWMIILGITLVAFLAGGVYLLFPQMTTQASDSKVLDNMSAINSSITNCINNEATKKLPWSPSGTDVDQFGVTIALTPAYYTSWANNCIRGGAKFSGTIVVNDTATTAPTASNRRVLGGAQFDTVYGTTSAGVIDASTNGKYLLVLRIGGTTATVPVGGLSTDLGVGSALAIASQPLEYAVTYKANFNPQNDSTRSLVTAAVNSGGKAGTDASGTSISSLAGKSGTYTNAAASTAGKNILILGVGPFDGSY